MRVLSGTYRRQLRAKRARRCVAKRRTLTNSDVVPSRSLRTANYSEEARRRLGDAVSEARRAAGYRWRTDFCRAHPEVSKSSLAAVEQARPGVGVAVLHEVGRLLGEHFPDW